MAGFRVMFCVWVGGEAEPRDIARLSGLSRAAVSSVLNTLERDGLIERTRESHDRRLVTVRLTDDGATRIVDAYRHQNDVEREFFAKPPQRRPETPRRRSHPTDRQQHGRQMTSRMSGQMKQSFDS